LTQKGGPLAACHEDDLVAREHEVRANNGSESTGSHHDDFHPSEDRRR